jgi:rare lipoprotein A
VNPELLQRQVALAAVALVATLGSLALDRAEAGGGDDGRTSAPTVVGRWYEAVVGTYGPGLYGKTTACGVKLTRETSGVAHPELPCGVKIVLANGSEEVQTAIIDKGLVGARHDFDVTQALAEDLGLAGVQLVRWRFAEKAG